VPHIGINISQDLARDLTSFFTPAPQHPCCPFRPPESFDRNKRAALGFEAPHRAVEATPIETTEIAEKGAASQAVMKQGLEK
jgi:hypothetical protein